MKIIILLLSITLFSCESQEDKNLKEAQEFIKKEKRRLHDDSVSIYQRLEIEKAQIRLRDTLR